MIFLSYLFYFITSSAAPIWRRYIIKKTNPAGLGQISFAFNVILITAIIGSFIPFFNPFHISGNIFYLLFLALICGLAGMGYFILSFVAQKHIEAGVTNLVLNIYTPITIVLATVLLNEKLTGLQIIGTILLLVAIVITSNKHRTSTFRFDKYLLMMLGSGVLMGFLLVAERTLQKTTGFTAGTLFSWWSQCLFVGLAVLVTKSKHSYSRKNVLLTGVISAVSSLSYVILVTVVGNLSLVSSITTFKVIIVFIGGAIFLRERDGWKRKVFGSIVALIGLLLMH